MLKRVVMSLLVCVCMLGFGVVKTANAAPATLTVMNQSVSGWNQNFNPFSNIIEAYRGFVYEPLVIYNGLNNDEVPWLAESVELQDDIQTVIVKLRKGVKWSDGEKFDADDVVFTYELFKKYPETDYSGMWGDKGKLKAIEKVDDYTVKFTMSEKNAFGVSPLFVEVWMLPKHIWSKIEDPTKKVVTNPVGTGPMTEVVRFTPQLFVMGRNPNYWQADKLKVDRMMWPQYNSNDAAYDMLMAGKIDWAHIFIPEIEKIYVDGSDTKKYWFPSRDGVRIAMNMQTKNENNRKAFKNVEFRKAFSLCMNRQDMMDVGAYGYVKGDSPATGLPPSLWGWRSPEADQIWAEYYTFDIAKAKTILADAGFKDIDHDGYVENPDGTPIKFDIQVPSGWTDWVNNCQIAVEGLRKAGINADVATPEVQAYVSAWPTGDFDVQFCGNGLAPTIYKFYEMTMTKPYFNSIVWWSSNLTKDDNPERDALIEKLKTAKSKDEQKEIVSEIEVYYAKNVPHIPLYYNGNWFVYNTSRFTGWATEDDPYCDPALANFSNRLLVLMRLKPVK